MLLTTLDGRVEALQVGFRGEKNQNTADGRGDQREDDDAVTAQNATGYAAGPWINR
jgi:hypothetical protein